MSEPGSPGGGQMPPVDEGLSHMSSYRIIYKNLGGFLKQKAALDTYKSRAERRWL